MWLLLFFVPSPRSVNSVWTRSFKESASLKRADTERTEIGEAMENSTMLVSMASLFHVAFAVLCALTILGELRAHASPTPA
jgi:uncharacterized membrane protein